MLSAQPRDLDARGTRTALQHSSSFSYTPGTCLTSSNLLLLLSDGDLEPEIKLPISELWSEQELGKLSVDPAELASLYERVGDPAG